MRGGSVVVSLLLAACFTDGGASNGASGGSGLMTAPTSATATSDTGEAASASAASDATTDPTTGEASTSTSTTTTAATASNGTSATADPTSTGESSTTATTSTSSTSGGGAPCKSDDDCGSNQFCDFPDVLCGAGNPGSCAPRPTECNDNEALTFGCDCLEYASPCLAQMAGTDVRGNIIDCD